MVAAIEGTQKKVALVRPDPTECDWWGGAEVEAVDVRVDQQSSTNARSSVMRHHLDRGPSGTVSPGGKSR
jgi:hypothetical protein